MERWERWALAGADVRASLAPGEALVAMQDGVGMYDRQEKVPMRSTGAAVLTTHRLAYVDAAHPAAHSCFVRLDRVRQTEHYAGFLKSSPKITVTLREDAALGGPWTCAVCGFQNVDTSSLDACALCGVARDAPQGAPSASAQAHHPAAADGPSEKACPACTFLNHPALPRCEICETPLEAHAPSAAPSAPPSAALHPLPFVKLSFRKGGDKPFYAQLRTTLQAKAWRTKPPRTGAGIHGVLRKDAAPPAPAPDAFHDLEALMKQAKQMVRRALTRRSISRRRCARSSSGASDSWSATGSTRATRRAR